MNIKKNILDFLYDRNYYITMYDNILFIHGFNKIELLSNSKIIILIEKKRYIISGSNIETTKMLENEICLEGNFASIKVSND